MTWIPSAVYLLVNLVVGVTGIVLLVAPNVARRLLLPIFPVSPQNRSRIEAALERRKHTVIFDRIVGVMLIGGVVFAQFFFKQASPLLVVAYAMSVIGVADFIDTLFSRVTTGPRAAQIRIRSVNDIFPRPIWVSPAIALLGVLIATDYAARSDVLYVIAIAAGVSLLVTLGAMVYNLRRSYGTSDPAADAYVDTAVRVLSATFLLTTATCLPLWARGAWPLVTGREWLGFWFEIIAIAWFLYWGSRLHCLLAPNELKSASLGSSTNE